MPGKTNSSDRVDSTVREAVAARLVSDAPRKEKSRLAASILFFEHGIYPSAKAVLECTQQGSLTDINRDVQEFWRDLREKSKVQLDAPALPDELLATFSEGLRSLWALAAAKADEGLDALRQEAEDQVRVAKLHAVEARQAQLVAEERIQAVEQELREERARREAAETRAEVQSAEIESLTGSIEQWRRRHADEAGARREAEERFSKDLDAERAVRQSEAERYQGEVRFAKQQIDAAREAERRTRDEVAVDMASYRKRLAVVEEARDQAIQLIAELKGGKLALERRVVELQDRVDELTKAAAQRATATKKVQLKRLRLR